MRDDNFWIHIVLFQIRNCRFLVGQKFELIEVVTLATSKAQKAQSFLNMPRMYSWKALKTLSRHPNCVFHARYDWKITFPDWKQKKIENFFEIFFDFFWKKLRKRRIVPKNEKGDPLGFINILFVAKYQKIRRGDSFETLKNFRKKFRTVPKKNWKGGPFGLFRFCRLRKKG